MDWFKKLLNHERYTAIALVLACFLVLWITACQSTVRSVLHPERKYTRQQMITERETVLAEYDVAFDQLDIKDSVKEFLLEKTLLVSQGGVFNPYALIPSIAALLGVGATVDRVRSVKKKKTGPGESSS